MTSLSTEQILDIIQTVAPAALSIVGAIVAALLAAIGWGLRRAFEVHTQRLANTTAALDALNKAVLENKKASDEEEYRLRDAIIGLRAEVAIGISAIRNEVSGVVGRVDVSIKGVSGVEAICRLQQDKLDKVSEMLAHVNGKLVAIFRFIDAKKRASDDDSAANG